MLYCLLTFNRKFKFLFFFSQALGQGNNHDAVAYMQRCKEMLLRLPKDVKNTPSVITLTTQVYNIVISHLQYILLLEVWVMLTVNVFFQCRLRTSPLCATTLE